MNPSEIPSFSIVLPAYNESENLPDVLRGLEKVLNEANIKSEIIVVDNGSSDNTEEVLELLKKNLKVEEQQACDHKMLSALFPNDIWYRCTNCNILWILTDAMVVKADKIPELIKKFQMVAKIKPKNKTEMSAEEFKKRSKKGNGNI